MKDILITVLLIIIVILTAIIDTTLTLDEERKVDCLFEQAKEQSEDWSLEDLYNPTGEWCFLEQEQPLPVDCQFGNNLLGMEID